MTTVSIHAHKSESTSVSSNAVVQPNKKEKTTMSKQAKKSATKTTAVASASTDTSSTAASNVDASTSLAPASNGAAVALIAPPPPEANIPSAPKGYDPTNGANYRGKMPRKAELVALPAALADLGRFGTYAQVLGTSAPPLAQVLAIFAVANEWSEMRNASTAWDVYCRDQEGMAWVSVHALMDRLRPSYTLAITADPTLATGFSGLTSLVSVKKVIAAKGASTKRLNKKAVADGKPPIHGAVGKRRQKAANKVAGAAAAAASTTATTSEPAVAPTVESTSAAPVTTAATSNGVAHS